MSKREVASTIAWGLLALVVLSVWFGLAFAWPHEQKCDNLDKLRATNQDAAVAYAKECP